MNFETIAATAGATLTLFGLKILGALLAWIVGRYLIGLAVRLISAAMSRQHVDPTLLRYIGNNKIFGDTIQNYSLNPYRRVERTAQLAHTVDVHDALPRLKAALAAIPNVLKDPAPDVEIIDFTPRGPVLAVRPYTHTDHYWQVYFDTNRAIVDAFGAAGYAVPEDRIRVLGALDLPIPERGVLQVKALEGARR